MFDGISSGPQVILRAQDIYTRLRTVLHDIDDHYGWLSAQSDGDLGQGSEGSLGFTPQQIGTLRGAAADANAVAQIIRGALPPSTYPQPASGYPYLTNMKEITGP
jgi:hypothetical protein